MSPPPRVIDLGCGNRKRAGAIGIDFNSRTAADVIHDLNRFPYPLESASFDEVNMDNVLEHLDDVVAVMEEVYRVCKPGGLVQIRLPYFRSIWAWIDPTHRHCFTVDSFSYFDPAHEHCERYAYSTARFSVEHIVFNEGLPGGLTRRAVAGFANRWPRRYEHYLSHLYPLDGISFYLRKR